MTTTDATYRKEICYDRETRDYAMYLDGELVGFERTYHQAEVTLDNLVFELMSGQHFADLTPAEVQQDIRQTEADTRDFCGDDHADTTCPQRRPLLAPRVCGNCGGQHSIQACPEIRAALFAA